MCCCCSYEFLSLIIFISKDVLISRAKFFIFAPSREILIKKSLQYLEKLLFDLIINNRYCCKLLYLSILTMLSHSTSLASFCNTSKGDFEAFARIKKEYEQAERRIRRSKNTFKPLIFIFESRRRRAVSREIEKENQNCKF